MKPENLPLEAVEPKYALRLNIGLTEPNGWYWFSGMKKRKQGHSESLSFKVWQFKSKGALHAAQEEILKVVEKYSDM